MSFVNLLWRYKKILEEVMFCANLYCLVLLKYKKRERYNIICDCWDSNHVYIFKQKIELIENENTVMIVIIILKNDVPGVVRYGYICLGGVWKFPVSGLAVSLQCFTWMLCSIPKMLYNVLSVLLVSIDNVKTCWQRHVGSWLHFISLMEK